MSDSRMSTRGDRLIRLADGGRILSTEECEAIARRVFDAAQGGGETRVGISSWWQGELRWARNRVSLASDRRDIRLRVTRIVDRAVGIVITNQVDDVSLAAAVRAAERSAQLQPQFVGSAAFYPPRPSFETPETAIWSDATDHLTTEGRGEVARALVGPAEEKGMLSAGYLEVRTQSRAEFTSAKAEASALPEWPYVACTQAQCSMTVRDQKGAGSGWAGLSGYDWSAIDPQALAARALEKALASRDPVALEPGRYTVILEPQAVCSLMDLFVGALSREPIETVGGGPFWLAYDDALKLNRTKLGLKVADERVTLSHDPADHALGVVPTPDMLPLDRVTWIDRGVLTQLSMDRDYALRALSENRGAHRPIAFRMSGGDTSVEEMIQTTKRGLLVTRFWGTRLLDNGSVLATGLTRDGVWLIENGKITKAVKNFRFTESPLFVLNSLDALGPAVPVFRPVASPYDVQLTPAIVPPLKARDFSLTSLVDAV